MISADALGPSPVSAQRVPHLRPPPDRDRQWGTQSGCCNSALRRAIMPGHPQRSSSRAYARSMGSAALPGSRESGSARSARTRTARSAADTEPAHPRKPDSGAWWQPLPRPCALARSRSRESVLRGNTTLTTGPGMPCGRLERSDWGGCGHRSPLTLPVLPSPGARRAPPASPSGAVQVALL